MEPVFKISNAKQYEEAMITIFEWQEQEEPLSSEEKAKMAVMLKEAERYEAEEL